MKFLVKNVNTLCSVEVEATDPSAAVELTPWPWDIVEIHEHGVSDLWQAIADRNLNTLTNLLNDTYPLRIK